MFKNESEFRNFVASLLEKEGFSIQKEVRVPEGYRVDLVATKNDLRSGIEVKLDHRGIADDISKGSILHKFPEFDHIYVAAPKMLISSELVSYAKQVRIGILGVKEDSVEWLQESQELRPAQLSGGGGYPNQVEPGSIFRVSSNVHNQGEKVARHLEMFFIPGGPFATAPKEKSRHKLDKLAPNEEWDVEFKVKVRKSAKHGTYPLFISCTADGMKAVDRVFNLNVTCGGRGKNYQ